MNKDMVNFLYVLALDLYQYLTYNLKGEIFQIIFDTFKPVSDFIVSSLKIINKN